MIAAVAVVVPARDEQQLIGPCLRSLREALDRLPLRVRRAVCVVADRCADDTAAIARATWDRAEVLVNTDFATVGELRDRGLGRARERLSASSAGTLLLSTDADSTVAADWAGHHLRLAERGATAVAGRVELTEADRLPPQVVARYAAVRSAARWRGGHGNVHAANLAVRADAYDTVGGFPPVVSGEDEELWRRLAAAGFRPRCAPEPRVRTSARRDGRAQGGVAALLRELSTVVEPATAG